MLVLNDCQAMYVRQPGIFLVAGIFLFVAFTDAVEILNSNKHHYIRPRIGGRIEELPPALRNRIADAFTTRGRDSSHLRTNEIPDVAPIIGGADAAEYKYPWFAHVLYASYDEDFQYFCGGTVYNERTVITAAHCVEEDPDQKDGLFAILAGDHEFDVDEELEQFVLAHDVRMHKGYRESGAFVLHHDIALLILEEPLNFTTIAIRPVPGLSTNSLDKTAVRSDNCVAIGYGAIQQHPEVLYADVLQELTPFNFAPHEVCRKALWKTEHCLTHNMICAIAQHADTCYGDSGGPVGCYDKKGVYYQVGIVSWGPTQICAGLGVYTRISKYRNWIKCYSYKV